jgi:antitoxin component YwqK of YwqJK toxin-antitoxin module
MKLLTTFILVYIQFCILAQLEENQQKKCYESKSAIPGKLSVVNECQKIAGIVDCGDDLSLDEDSKLIFKNKELKPFTGTCQSCHWNGKLDRKINFVNGKENGLDSTFYASGCLQVVRNHIQGVESGKWVYYFDSTAITAWEMNYQNGRKHGQKIYFNNKCYTTRI